MTPQAALDLLADQLLVDVAPLVVDVASSADEIAAVQRLRYACAVEKGWVQPEQHPDGRERDEADERGVVVVCRLADVLVGATRLVPPVAGRLLPLEEEFDVRIEPPAGSVEAGRVVVAREHRSGRSHTALAGLFARSWLVTRELGFDRVVGCASNEALGLYRGLGLRVAVLGPARWSRGEERRPLAITGADPAALTALTGAAAKWDWHQGRQEGRQRAGRHAADVVEAAPDEPGPGP